MGPFRIGDHRHRKGPHGKPGLRRKYVAIEKGGRPMGLQRKSPAEVRVA